MRLTKEKEETVVQLPVNQLCPFEENPYQVRGDEEMVCLVESIQSQGVLTPVTVRKLGDGNFEVISGHRRLHACQVAGIQEIPAIVVQMSREEAAVALVDSNLHREHILPSEKAFAYKMKMEALSHRGVTFGQVGHKSRENVTSDESGRQVQRYIRLTYLLPDFLQLVDNGKIALTPAVELSYLPENAQAVLLEEIHRNDCTPSLSQAVRLKKQYQAETLTAEGIREIMSEKKANQKERIHISTERIRKYFPKSYTVSQIEDAVVKLCERDYHRRADRER